MNHRTDDTTSMERLQVELASEKRRTADLEKRLNGAGGAAAPARQAPATAPHVDTAAEIAKVRAETAGLLRAENARLKEAERVRAEEATIQARVNDADDAGNRAYERNAARGRDAYKGGGGGAYKAADGSIVVVPMDAAPVRADATTADADDPIEAAYNRNVERARRAAA